MVSRSSSNTCRSTLSNVSWCLTKYLWIMFSIVGFFLLIFLTWIIASNILESYKLLSYIVAIIYYCYSHHLKLPETYKITFNRFKRFFIQTKFKNLSNTGCYRDLSFLKNWQLIKSALLFLYPQLRLVLISTAITPGAYKGGSPLSDWKSCDCKIRSLNMPCISFCTRSRVFISFAWLKKSSTSLNFFSVAGEWWRQSK